MEYNEAQKKQLAELKSKLEARRSKMKVGKPVKSKVLEDMKRAYEHSKQPKPIDWKKSNPKGSVAWPKTEEQKAEHQRIFKRAWND